jgi:succinyl-CoA synthetase beta subunit
LKLLEHQAKQVFTEFRIPTPRSSLATSPEEAKDAAKRLGGPVAVKAQLPVGGRGRAGGILFAKTPQEAAEAAGNLLGRRLKGLDISEVLIEDKLTIVDELYVSITLDREQRTYVVLSSSEGGVDIEEVASKTPEKIIRHTIDPLLGLRSYHANWVAKSLGYSGREMQSLASVIIKLYRVAAEMDAELVEINPLVWTGEGFVAADAKLIIDDNSLFRHPDLAKTSKGVGSGLSERELTATEKGLTYVELEGNIGIIGNGAGLTMATLDTVSLRGGMPANFLDLGGGASPERIETAVSFILVDPRVDAVFVNILGGITRCDDTAHGIIRARERTGIMKPIVVRMMGTNEEIGRQLLKEAGIETLETMEEGAVKVVSLSRRSYS